MVSLPCLSLRLPWAPGGRGVARGDGDGDGDGDGGFLVTLA